MTAAPEAHLFAREGDEDDRSTRRMSSDGTGKLEQHGYARSIVIRAMKDAALAVLAGMGIPRRGKATSEMIIVGADHDRLRGKNWIGAAHQADHIGRHGFGAFEMSRQCQRQGAAPARLLARKLGDRDAEQ